VPKIKESKVKEPYFVKLGIMWKMHLDNGKILALIVVFN
jgi:hypothetical protein